MLSTEIVTELMSACEHEALRLIDDVDHGDGSAGLFAIGAVAEVVALAGGIDAIGPLRRLVCDASARWLQSGQLEDYCFSRIDCLYHAALLCGLAQLSDTYDSADSSILNRLCHGRLIGRSESPVLNQRLIVAYFQRCGIVVDFGAAGDRDLTRMLNKRVLRPRSDEYDLLALLMYAQLLHLGNSTGADPLLCPQVLLVQAMRSQNVNWVPVLAFLSERFFRVEDRLLAAARRFLLTNLPRSGALLPAPIGSGTDSDFVLRGGAGLRIRSTAALACLLCTKGDIYADNRAALAFD